MRRALLGSDAALFVEVGELYRTGTGAVVGVVRTGVVFAVLGVGALAGYGQNDYKTQPQRVAEVASEKKAEWNRRIGREFYQCFRARDLDGLGTIIDSGYIQHQFTMADGGWAKFREILKRTFNFNAGNPGHDEDRNNKRPIRPRPTHPVSDGRLVQPLLV